LYKSYSTDNFMFPGYNVINSLWGQASKCTPYLSLPVDKTKTGHFDMLLSRWTVKK
jgi:hypothetical protein